MDTMDKGPAIGCDGGGSGARLVLLWEGVRHEVTGGPANVMSDRIGALAQIVTLLEQAAARAGVSLEALADVPAHLALAGVVDVESAEAVARELPLRAAVVEEDRRAAVRGALGSAEGTVAGIGTGSYVARQGAEGFRTIGGHGLVLGDQASGAWAGRALLRAVLAAEDGLTPPSDLTRQTLHEMGGSAGIVGFAAEAEPKDFARLAPLVFDSLADPVADSIIAEGADYLERALLAVGWRAGEALCLAGGVGGRYASRLPPEMQAALVAPRGTSLDGALALALEAARTGD